MRSLDPELHRRLSRVIANGRRSVKAVARANILPKETIFFDHPISMALSGRNGRAQRIVQRGIWLRKALRSTSDCDLVFFDPDNVIETKSVPFHSPKSGKYIFCYELVPFLDI